MNNIQNNTLNMMENDRNSILIPVKDHSLVELHL